MFNRNHHSGMLTGLDSFGSMFNADGGPGELTWNPNANLSFSDNIYFINGVVTAIGGTNNNFTDKNSWTTEVVDGSQGWRAVFPMPSLAANTAIAFGVTEEGNSSNNFTDINYCFYFNGAVAGDIYAYEDGNIRSSASGVPDGAEIVIQKLAGDPVPHFIANGVDFFTSIIPYVGGNYKLKVSVYQTAGTIGVKSFMNI